VGVIRIGERREREVSVEGEWGLAHLFILFLFFSSFLIRREKNVKG